MSKEQKRGNKEARKQKGEKKKPVAVAASVSSLMASATPNGRASKGRS